MENRLGEISADVVLPSRLRKLDLRHCRLKHIQKGSFRQFQKLEYLDISFNRELTLEVLPNISFDLQFTNIQVFKFNSIQCKFGDGIMLRRRHIYHLTNTSLKEIHLSSNRIESLERYVITDLPKTLERIEAANNRFKIGFYFLEVNLLANIRFVDLSSQLVSYEIYLSPWLGDCNDTIPNPNSYNNDKDMDFEVQDLQVHEHIQYGSCMTEYSRPTGRRTIYICLPLALKTLILSHCELGSTDELDTTYFDLRNIEKFIMTDNFRTNLKGEIFGNTTTYLDYSRNYISYIHPLFFKHANLTHLNLSINYLGNQLSSENSTKLLHGQIYLVNLSLASNGIFTLPSSFFDSMPRLHQVDLSDNNIEKLTFGLRILRQLRVLNLSPKQTKNFIY